MSNLYIVNSCNKTRSVHMITEYSQRGRRNPKMTKISLFSENLSTREKCSQKSRHDPCGVLSMVCD